MAGANKMLKAGQVVFRAGEAADGMYLVRKGELVVYLEQDGKEVVLAKINEGGMIGEMALFDRQPRSASVKASTDAEVTLISLDDFSKLMKQIPKWFVGLMTALSGRLRTTNDRLKQVESSNKAGSPATSTAKPFQSLLRMVNVLELMWHRDGTKEGKDWCLQRKLAENCLIQSFGEPEEKVKALLKLLEQEQIVSNKSDQYKNAVLALANRGALRQFSDFILEFTTKNPTMRGIPAQTMEILKILHKMGSKAPYEQFTATAEEIVEEAKANGINPADWGPFIKNFPSYGEAIKPVKSSSKSGMAIRVIKEDFPGVLKNLNTFNRIQAAKLDQ